MLDKIVYVKIFFEYSADDHEEIYKTIFYCKINIRFWWN